MDIEIITADFSYSDKICKLENQCFSAPWSKKLILDEINNPDSVFLAALYDGCFAGYVSGKNIAGEFYLNNIAVEKPYRKMGVAYELMNELKNRVTALCCSFLTLEVRLSNTPARQLYEKCCYINMGERKNFYVNPTENAVIYTLYL